MKKPFIIAALLAAPLAVGSTAEAQTPGVCPTIYVAFNEDQIVATTLSIHNTQFVTVRQDGAACPTGSEDEAVDALVAQIRTGVVDCQDFNGRRRLVPPSRVTAYVLPSAYLPQYPN